MLKKIFIFIGILFKCNISFKIQKKDLVIFDLKSLNAIRSFSNYDFFILETRPHEIKNIYLNLYILNYILKIFLKENYLRSIYNFTSSEQIGYQQDR